MRRLALLITLIAAISACERVVFSPRFAAIAARMVRVPARLSGALRELRLLWRQRVKALSMPGVN